MRREEFTVELQYIKPCILKRVQRGVARAEVVHQQHHGLPTVSGQKAIAEVFLQSKNVLVLQKFQ